MSCGIVLVHPYELLEDGPRDGIRWFRQSVQQFARQIRQRYHALDRGAIAIDHGQVIDVGSVHDVYHLLEAHVNSDAWWSGQVEAGEAVVPPSGILEGNGQWFGFYGASRDGTHLCL